MSKRILSLFRNLFRKRAVERELNDELRSSLEILTQEKMKQGLSQPVARREALIELGGIEQVKEEVRAVRVGRILEDFARDIRFGLRRPRRNPSFTAVAVLTLALGIGANTAIFSVVYDVLLKPLPYPDPGRLTWVARTQPPFPPNWSLPFSGPNFLDLEHQNRGFAYLAAMIGHDFNWTGKGEPEVITSELATANFFKLLEIQPMLGRGFLPGEDQEGHNREVVLSYSFWQRKYGGAPDIIGKTMDLSEQTYTIVGVMPRGFGYPYHDDALWAPLVVPKTGRGDNSYRAIGRLKPGVTLAQARADMSMIARRLAAQHPDTNSDEGVMLLPLQVRKGEFLRPTLLILFAAVGLLLLIACANVANLLLARGAVREREMAVRASLGAGRRRLIGQLLAESILLALLGGAAALLVGHWSIDLLRALKPNNIPGLKEIGISLPVFWFALGIAILTGVIFGLVPAFQVSGVQLNEALKSSGSGPGTSAERGRARNILVVVQVALSLMLLAGAGLMIRSFARFTGVDPGFNPHHLLRFDVWLPAAKYKTDAQVKEFYRVALARIDALPAVDSAAASYPVPPSGGESDGGFYVEGHKPPTPNGEADAIWHTITPGYFQTMQTPILRGRAFTRQDTAKSLPVVIINQTLARHFFPGQNPLGKRLKVGVDNEKGWWQIVGVAADQAYAGWDGLYSNEVYFPFAREPWGGDFVVRTKVAPAAAASEIRKAIWSVDKDLPVIGMETMEEALDHAYRPRRFNMALLVAFALLAVIIAAVGIYGVMSYTVARRTHEIGVRMALGAQKGHVLKVVMGQGMLLALIGVAAGIAGAFGLTRFLSSMLFGVEPTDALTFVIVSLVLLAVAMLACYIPARRATKVDPMVALRYE
jgi:predicted permease